MSFGSDKRSSSERELPGVKISIVVPVYNVNQYLNECLESLSRQTLKEIEIICIDDGSTDGSSETLDAFAEGNERFRIVHQDNHGVTFTRNKGLDLARGEYVLFVDSDDLIDGKTCSVLYDAAKRDKAEIVVFGGKTFPTLLWADASFAARDCVYKDGIKALLDEQGSIPLMCNKLYSRDLLERNSLRFCDDLVLGEDHAFQMIAFPYAKTVSYINDKLYFYRIREDSAVGRGSDDASKRTWLHYDVVRFVLEEWARRGILKKHPGEGFSWAVDFISNSFYDCDYDEKLSFARKFVPYLKNLASKHSGGRLDLDEAAAARFAAIEKHCDIVAQPFFTIVIDCSKNAEKMRRCIESVKCQSEETIEVFLLSDEDNPIMDELLCKDVRLKILRAGSPIDAIKQARGRYLLSIDADVAFAPTAFEELKSLVERAESRAAVQKRCDVVTFSDSASLLGVRDFYEFADPLSCKVFDGESLHPKGDFGSNLLSFAGFFTCNKIFSLAFLNECFAESGIAVDSWFDMQFLALLRAENILPTTRPLMSFYGSPVSDDSEIRSLFDAVSDAALFVDGEAARKAFFAASMKYFALLSIFVKGRKQEDSFCRAFRSFVDENRVEDCDVECDLFAAKVRSLVEEESSEAYLQETRAQYLELLLGKVGEYRALAINEGARADSVAAEFYSSTSYRLGRAITAAPRVMIRTLKKIR